MKRKLLKTTFTEKLEKDNFFFKFQKHINQKKNSQQPTSNPVILAKQ